MFPGCHCGCVYKRTDNRKRAMSSVLYAKDGRVFLMPTEMVREWREFDVSCRNIGGECVLLMYNKLFIGKYEVHVLCTNEVIDHVDITLAM